MANTVMNVLKKTQDFLLRRRFLDGNAGYYIVYPPLGVHLPLLENKNRS